MQSLMSLRKVVWAIDIFESMERMESALSVWRTLTRVAQIEIQPVYVLYLERGSKNSNAAQAHQDSMRAAAERRMSEQLSKVQIPGLLPGVVLLSTDHGVRACAQRLLDFATEISARLIVVATHARTGVPRLFLGSFAESLFLQSEISVLTLNPEAEALTEIDTILFPTDFFPAARQGFEATVEMAKLFGARVVAFFKEPMLYLVSPDLISAESDSYRESEERDRKLTAEQWQGWAKGFGVEVETYFDPQVGNPAQAIVDFATHRKVSLISVVSTGGAVSSLLLGSVTRQVVRMAQCPVLVRHSAPQKPTPAAEPS